MEEWLFSPYQAVQSGQMIKYTMASALAGSSCDTCLHHRHLDRHRRGGATFVFGVVVRACGENRWKVGGVSTPRNDLQRRRRRRGSETNVAHLMTSHTQFISFKGQCSSRALIITGDRRCRRRRRSRPPKTPLPILGKRGAERDRIQIEPKRCSPSLSLRSTTHSSVRRADAPPPVFRVCRTTISRHCAKRIFSYYPTFLTLSSPYT